MQIQSITSTGEFSHRSKGALYEFFWLYDTKSLFKIPATPFLIKFIDTKVSEIPEGSPYDFFGTLTQKTLRRKFVPYVLKFFETLKLSETPKGPPHEFFPIHPHGSASDKWSTPEFFRNAQNPADKKGSCKNCDAALMYKAFQSFSIPETLMNIREPTYEIFRYCATKKLNFCDTVYSVFRARHGQHRLWAVLSWFY